MLREMSRLSVSGFTHNALFQIVRPQSNVTFVKWVYEFLFSDNLAENDGAFVCLFLLRRVIQFIGTKDLQL